MFGGWSRYGGSEIETDKYGWSASGADMDGQRVGEMDGWRVGQINMNGQKTGRIWMVCE
jgi:hypothetical protein